MSNANAAKKIQEAFRKSRLTNEKYLKLFNRAYPSERNYKKN